MKISIIVPTRDRCSLLRKAIKSFVAQSLPADQFEIVVVDNGSTDATRETVEALQIEHPAHQLRYILEPAPGLLSGRHRGAKEARADLLVYTDDDIEAVPGWLAAIVSGFVDPKVQLLGGKNLPKYEGPVPHWIEQFWEAVPDGGQYCFYLSLLDLGDEPHKIDPRLIFGCNFAIRAKALGDLGGFHPDLYPKGLEQFDGDGETGLAQAAEFRGYISMYEPKATVLHLVPASRMTPEYFEARSYSEGTRMSYTQARTGGLPPRLGIARKLRRFAGRMKRRCVVFLKSFEHAKEGRQRARKWVRISPTRSASASKSNRLGAEA